MSKSKSLAAIYREAPLAHRKTMRALRDQILEVIPNAEEVISYGMPAFRVDGNVVAGIMAAKNHVGYYPFSGSVLSLFPKELAKYKTTKSAIHVPIGESLSKAVVTKLIRARISQCPVKAGKIDLSNYAKRDSYWRELGLAAPARRGLVDNNLFKLADLKRISNQEFMKIHAIGPKAAALIINDMKKHKFKFKNM